MHCILIAGPPACGKSTFASFLSERMALPVFSKDEIKEVLFDCIGFNSRQEKRRLDVCATDLMYLFAKKSLSVAGASSLTTILSPRPLPPFKSS